MKSLSVATYAALRDKVRETLLLGQRQIEESKVRTYWETGSYINAVCQGQRRKGGVRRKSHPETFQRPQSGG